MQGLAFLLRKQHEAQCDCTVRTCLNPTLGKQQQGFDVVNQGSQDMYATFGDSDSSLALNVHNAGSSKTYITFEDEIPNGVARCEYNYGSGDTNSRASSAGVPCYANNDGDWPQNVRNGGSGHLYIKYGNCRSSTSRVDRKVFNAGSGVIKMSYGNCYPGTFTIDTAGSSNLSIEGLRMAGINTFTIDCAGSSNINIKGLRMARSNTFTINKAGSGNVSIEGLRMAGNNFCTIRNAGSGNVYLKGQGISGNTCTISNAGSGHVYSNDRRMS